MSRCVLFAGLLLMCHRAIAASIPTSGDVEGTTYSQTFDSYTDTLPTDWGNSPPTSMSNVNVFANGSGPGTAQSGTHYLAFQSLETDGSQDCLYQYIPTVAGQQYTVSFWIAMTPSSGSQFGLSPEWDAVGANNTLMGTGAFYDHPNNSPAVPYTFFSFTETASSSSTLMFFHGADATGAVLVDNASVSPSAGASGPRTASLLLLLRASSTDPAKPLMR